MKFRFKLLLLALTLLTPCVVGAANQEEPTIYVIKQGDTLWGLSDRFIKDPKYWPNMWSKNDQITNPHLIYPGQKVRVFPDRLEFAPKEETNGLKTANSPAVKTAEQTAVAEKSYVVRGSEGFLLESAVKPSGAIIGIHGSRILAGYDDIVYTDIGKVNGVKGGEKFSVFRKEALISHPATNEIMGTKIVPLGRLQLTDLEEKSSRAIITETFKEISPGAFLLPYRADKKRVVSLKRNTKELKGYLIESYSGTSIIAAGDIVYIDLGNTQGAEPGNMLYIVRDVQLDKKLVEGRVDKLPQELLGALVILETGNKTATAIVVKSIDAIYKGDRIVSQTY